MDQRIEQLNNEIEENLPTNPEQEQLTEEEEDDDNITVTLPTAHQQSRGANFRDSRIRRIPSYGLESQSSIRSSQDEESENMGENSSDHYSNRINDNGSKRNNDRYSSDAPQGITSLANDKNGNQNIYPIHSSSMNSHNDYPPQQQQSQSYQNPGMVQQMHPQSMYQQGHYQQQGSTLR